MFALLCTEMGLTYSFGLALTLFWALVQGTPLCDETQRVEISNLTLSSFDGRLAFAEGTYWYHQDGATYGCPCLLKSCLKPCLGLYNESALDKNTHTMLHGESKHVRVHENFHLLHPVNETIEGSSMCFILEDVIDFKLLQNGSMFLLDSGITIDIDQFCVKSENGALNAVVCQLQAHYEDHDEEPAVLTKQFSLLYAILGCISCLFLFLVVVLYFVIPEMRTQQNKSVIFQSATLAIGLVGVTVLHLHRGLFDHPHACQFFAHVSQYFILSSFAWLSTMCFDMFWTFSALKNMAEMSQSSGQLKFRIYGVIAFVGPLSILSLTKILDLALNEQWEIWPGIGFKKCWFQNRVSDFCFFQGPLLLMLLSNVVFSVATLASICRIKREMKCLHAAESRTFNSNENWQNLWLTLKLFTLMGGTWLMEFVTWALEYQGVFATICDSINILRGPIVFYLCVLGNAKVRKALLFCLKPEIKRSRKTSQSTTHSDITSGATTSLTVNAETAF